MRAPHAALPNVQAVEVANRTPHTLPSALAADLLTSAWDQNAAIYAHSPAAAIVEEVAGAWLKDILNIPSTASFAFTNGCQMAHFAALAAARHHVLARFSIDIEEAGLGAAPAIRVLTSRKVHTSSVSAIRMLGIGSSNIHYFAFLGEIAEGSSAPSMDRLVLVASVFIGLGLTGILIAYAFLAEPCDWDRTAKQTFAESRSEHSELP